MTVKPPPNQIRTDRSTVHCRVCCPYELPSVYRAFASRRLLKIENLRQGIAGGFWRLTKVALGLPLTKRPSNHLPATCSGSYLTKIIDHNT